MSLKRIFPVVLIYLSSALLAFAQTNMKIFVDGDAVAGATDYEVMIIVNDANVRSLLISSQRIDASKWRTHAATKDTKISEKLEIVDGKPTSYSIISFDGNGRPTEVKNLTIPNAMVAGGTVSPKGSRSGGIADPQGKIRLQAPTEIADRTTVSLRIFPQDLKIESGEYVILVKGPELTRKTTVRILPDEKDPKIKSPQDEVVRLFEGKNTITVYPKTEEEELEDWKDHLDVICEPCEESGSSSSTRAVIGFEQVGASASGSKQSPFLDFHFDTPFTFGTKKKPWFSVWGNIRLSSIPVQSFVSFSNLTAFPSFIDESTQKSNDLAQSFDFLVGLETKLPIKGILGRGFLPGKSSMYLIAGVGAVNPLAPDRTAQIFKVPMISAPTPMTGMIVDPKFEDVFPEARGKTNIAFVSPERDRFFRQYYGGLRLKTHFYEGDINRPKNLFPAMVDITVGQNEQITGSLRGLIGRLDASTPLPIKGADYLYIFGSAQLRFGRKVNRDVASFFLERADSSATLTNADTAVVPYDRYPQTISNRDRFRLGIGIDLFRLFRQEKKEQ